MKPRVVLFGLDGATYDVLDDLIARGLMPNLKKFYGEGTRAKMLSTVPPLTPLAWSSLVTGRSPGNHGVLGFMQYSDSSSESINVVSSRQFTAETIWSMVNRQGMRAGSLNFVAHQPAPKIDGWVVPGWVSWRWMKRLSHPADLIDRLKRELPGFDVKSLALDFDEERKAVVGAPLDDYGAWIKLHLKREQQWFDALQYLQAREPAELVGVVFDGVDKLQHLLWPYLDPALAPAEPSPEFLDIRKMSWEYFQLIDRLLGETVASYGDSATILICSDHGFTGSWEVLYINTWLEKHGYLTWAPEAQQVEEGCQELQGAYYDMHGFVWDGTTAYAVTPSSNGIFINVRGRRRPSGIPPEEYECVRRELTHKLLTECNHPDTGEPLIERVYTREEAFAGKNMDNAPDLTLALRDKGFVSVRRTNSYYAPRPAVLGTHHPEGVLIARGPGIRKGACTEPVSLMDVTPTALFAMGLDVPEDLEGRVLEELYLPEYIAARGPKRGTATAEAVAVMAAGAQDEDAQIIEKMKALGYLE